MKPYVLGLGLAVFTAGAAFAGGGKAPEIDAGSMAVPLALLGGAVLIVRSRFRR